MKNADDGDQREFPALPDAKLPQEKFIDLVAGICGMDMGDVEKALKTTMIKPSWPQLSRPGQEAWWKQFAAGEKAGLKPQ